MLTRLLIALCILVLAVALTPTAARAEVACKLGYPTAYDMVGHYESVEVDLTVNIYACGGVYVKWQTAAGLESNAYATVNHLDGGGILAIALPPIDPCPPNWLGGTEHLIVKPSERGWIEVEPLDPKDGPLEVYRLKQTR